MIDTRNELEQEYCPPIDTALFHAILSDFDVSTSSGLQNARSTLDTIRQNAEAEEATGFDPSGSSSFAVGPAFSESTDPFSSRQGESSRSAGSMGTSAFDSIKSSESEPPQSTDLDIGIEGLSFDNKLALLSETFPKTLAFTISHALRKCKEDFEKTVDELLTAEFLARDSSDSENLMIPKGVDGFAQNSNFRKRKGRRKKDKNAAQTRPGLFEETPVMNTWDRASQEINYIAKRTNIATSVVTSTYHTEGASLSKTIIALSKDSGVLESTPSADEPLIKLEIAQIAGDFPDMTLDQLTGIVRLTHPATAAAHELAKATLRNPFPVFKQHSEGNIVPSYARLKIDESLSDTSSESSRTKKSPARSTGTSNHAAALANTYASARRDAFAKASAAYRKSNSNRLMGGVASYYAEVGRDAQAKAETYSAQAADSLVARQSTAKDVDLHGVDVANSVRIALEKVEEWWVSGASEWARQGKVRSGEEFSIITGVGKHSQSGRARIGPAVKRALIAQGWAIDVYDGVVVVRGKART